MNDSYFSPTDGRELSAEARAQLADWRPTRLGVLDCRTSGTEEWLLEGWLQILALSRDGGLTVTLSMSCRHRESFDAGSPPALRARLGEPCTRCMLFDKLRKERSA